MLATFFVVEKENRKGVSSGFFVSNTWNLVVQKKDVLGLGWKKVSAEHKDASSWFVLIQNEKKWAWNYFYDFTKKD